MTLFKQLHHCQALLLAALWPAAGPGGQERIPGFISDSAKGLSWENAGNGARGKGQGGTLQWG